MPFRNPDIPMPYPVIYSQPAPDAGTISILIIDMIRAAVISADALIFLGTNAIHLAYILLKIYHYLIHNASLTTPKMQGNETYVADTVPDSHA